MNKDIAIQLNDTVQRIKDYYSDPNRDCNYNNEQFTIDKIIPTSDQTAIVIFAKSGGKKALAFFYYINIARVSGNYTGRNYIIRIFKNGRYLA